MSIHPSVDALETKRRRLTFLIVQLLALCLIGAAFALRHLLAHLSERFPSAAAELPMTTCLMSLLFHIYCPLCGGTRAVVALCQGKLLLSLQYNPVSAYLAVTFVVCDILAAIRIHRRAPVLVHLPRLWWIAGITLAALVFIVRNVALIGYGLDNLGELEHYWH